MIWLKSLLTGLCLCISLIADENKQTVCVTYYWPGSAGQVGNKTSTGKPAKHLQTCAVDPKIFPYGTKIYVHEMDKTFIANDTGAWVKKRVAAKKQGRNLPVIDIFVSSRTEARKMIKKYPKFVTVTIKK